MSVELEREIETLRERLAEADQMRRAIVRAEVDGFVVGDGDGERHVQLLTSAQSRDLVERSRRLQASDERTRRFLGMLATELIAMLKAMRVSVELLKTQDLADECVKAVDSLDKQIGSMRQLAEDLRTINPKDD